MNALGTSATFEPQPCNFRGFQPTIRRVSSPCPIRSPTSTSTPSSRCSTGRRASTSSSPRRSATASRRSASPITATCTGSLEFYKECNKQGVKPIIGTEAYMAHDHRSERPTAPRTHRRLRWRHRGRQEALLPPHPAGRERPGLPQPDPALQPGLHGGLLLQAADGLGAARAYSRGPDRHHRLPRRPRAAVAAAAATTRVRSTRPAGCRTSSARTTCSSSCRTTVCRPSATPTRS